MITYLFAGGGTGGHLYPGLAIAEQIRKASPDGARILFLCSDRPLDREILEKAGAEFVPSAARPLSLRLTEALKFCQAWRASVRQARGLMRDQRAGQKDAAEPGGVIVVAMGGFVAAPAVKAAQLERVPVAMVNLDAVPGKANRWIAGRTQMVFSAARVRAGGGLPGATVMVPPIVRAQAASVIPSAISRAECRKRLGLDVQSPTLMVTGGSQGAQSINAFMAAYALSDRGQHSLKIDPKSAGQAPWQIIHQTGKGEDTKVAEAYKQAGITAVVRPFSDAMGDWWGAADLAIARAGAGNVGEVWANKVPTIFFPYPFHADEHQRYNAIPLEEAGGARIVRDCVEPEKNLETAGPVLSSLLDSSELRKQMWAALEKLGPADGAAQIARALVASMTPAAGYAR